MKYTMYNHSGSLNRGCEAIVRGTMASVVGADQQAEFKLFSHHPEDDVNIDGISVFPFKDRELSNFEKAVAYTNIKLFNNEKYSVKKSRDNFFNITGEDDVFLSIGGDAYCYGPMPKIQLINEMLKKSRKKIVLWGASLGEENLSDAVINDINNYNIIFAREPLSYEVFKKSFPQKEIFQCDDPAFLMNPEPCIFADSYKDKKSLGINISPFVVAKNKMLINYTVDFLKDILINTDINIVIVPHCTPKDNNDMPVLNKIIESLPISERVIVLPDNLNAMQYKYCISKLTYFIGARTHATIAAYSSLVPTFVIGYSVKSKGISSRLFGEEKYLMSAGTIDSASSIMKSFEQIVSDENKIILQLSQSVKEAKKSAMSAGKILYEAMC